MGNKVWIVGVTLLLATPILGGGSALVLAGAVVACLGAVLVVLDK